MCESVQQKLGHTKVPAPLCIVRIKHTGKKKLMTDIERYFSSPIPWPSHWQKLHLDYWGQNQSSSRDPLSIEF